MGKKTIKVAFIDKVSFAAFAQNQNDLLKIYRKEDLNGMWGGVIAPLHGSNGKCFYYRKKLPNNKMLVCGEFYGCDSRDKFIQELDAVESEFNASLVEFIEEDSLTNDDGDYYSKVVDEYWRNLMEQKRDLDINEPPVRQLKHQEFPELRAYVVNWDDVPKDEEKPLTNEEFMTEAERQGLVYSMLKFQEAYNDDEINSVNTSVRFLTVLNCSKC